MLYRNASAHDLAIDGRVLATLEENRLNVAADVFFGASEGDSCVPPFFMVNFRHDDGDVDVAPLMGAVLGVGAEHHDLHRRVEAWSDDGLIAAYQLKGELAW